MFYRGIAGSRLSDSTLVHESFSTDSDGVNNGRLAIVGGTLLSSMVVIHFYQQNGWWKDNRTSFHFQEDLEYGLWVDKVGHFYGAYLLSFLISSAVEWANVPEERALWIGSAGGLLFQTYVEVEDGFSTWGFDRVDFAADVAGAAWPVARYYVSSPRNVDLKLSYRPSPLLGAPGGIGFHGQQHLVIDDYEGQNFWLSMKVENVLPQAWKPYWPDFLCVALGYGARDVAGDNPHRAWYLALDYDMTNLIPPKTGFLRKLGEVLNFIHLPAPAVQFHPGAVWYGLYF